MHSVPDTTNKAVTPTVRKIPLSADNVLRALLSLSPHRRLSLLDSCGARDSSARYLIAGFDPFEIIEASGTEIRRTSRGEQEERVTNTDALDLLDARDPTC